MIIKRTPSTIPVRSRAAYAAGLLLGFTALLGCSTAIVPLKPVTTVEEWVPSRTTSTAPATQSEAATHPAPSTQVALTEPSTTSAPETQAATTPTTQVTTVPTEPKLVKHSRVVDPNQSVRYVYRGNYQHIWQEATGLLTHLGYVLDRQDYRMGVITTRERIAAQVAEPWRRDQTNASTALENTVNYQRRKIRLTIRVVEDRPEFYEIAVQVLVERLTNPQENIGDTAFARGSGFGATSLALQSDYVAGGAAPSTPVTIDTPTVMEEEPATPPATHPASTPATTRATTRAYDPTTRPAGGDQGPSRWAIRGHEPRLEQKILTQLLDKI